MILKQEGFRNETFSQCKSATEVREALISSESWYLLSNEQPIAVFQLQTSGPAVTISKICASVGPKVLSAALRNELREKKISNITLQVAPSEVDGYTASGFAPGELHLRYSRTPKASNMMPILPLANPSQKELPNLSELMHTAYAKSQHPLLDGAAEEMLQEIMSGARGEYISNASFVSGIRPNLVSACLLTLDKPSEASINQLFTHPLYRARGLATVEIAASMNQLVASGIGTITAWVGERNDVVKRLLTKMEFRQGRSVIEMTGKT